MTTTTKAHLKDDPELDDVIDEAEEELPEGELRETFHQAGEAGERAGRSALKLWVLIVVAVAVLVAAAIGDPRFALLLPVLVVFYTFFVFLMGYISAEREAEKESISEVLEEHEHHEAHARHEDPSSGRPAA